MGVFKESGGRDVNGIDINDPFSKIKGFPFLLMYFHKFEMTYSFDRLIVVKNLQNISNF